jgi:hypothetical protein
MLRSQSKCFWRWTSDLRTWTSLQMMRRNSKFAIREISNFWVFGAFFRKISIARTGRAGLAPEMHSIHRQRVRDSFVLCYEANRSVSGGEPPICGRELAFRWWEETQNLRFAKFENFEFLEYFFGKSQLLGRVELV